MASCRGVKPKPYSSARGGAWRNSKLTGGPYVCEQCRLDACGGNDATLTIHTAIRPHCGVALVLIYPCGKGHRGGGFRAVLAGPKGKGSENPLFPRA